MPGVPRGSTCLSEAQGWPTPGRSVVGGHLPTQRAGKPGLRLVGHLQVLLTGKPCRNFQVLVAYSMLQMVREQVLQESLTSDGILLVRGPWGRASPSPTPTPPTPPMPSQPSGRGRNWVVLSTELVSRQAGCSGTVTITAAP